jgi:hypothetical protein
LRRKPSPASVTEEDPAAALKAKLEESRAVIEDREEFESGETPVDKADPEARRREVHDAARARLDELSGPDER